MKITQEMINMALAECDIIWDEGIQMNDVRSVKRALLLKYVLGNIELEDEEESV